MFVSLVLEVEGNNLLFEKDFRGKRPFWIIFYLPADHVGPIITINIASGRPGIQELLLNCPFCIIYSYNLLACNLCI